MTAAAPSEALFAGGAPTAAGYRDVTPAALDAALDAVRAARADGPPDVRLVDVREAHELASELGHIVGVEHVPVAEVPAAATAWPRDQTIVLICRSGARSARAAQGLVAAGFGRVMNLAGGMLAYRAAGYPTAQR